MRAVYVGEKPSSWTHKRHPTRRREKLDNLARARAFIRTVDEVEHFAGPAPVPLWVAGQLDINQPLVWLAFDDIRNIEFDIEENETFGDGRKFVGLRFFNAKDQLQIDETKGSDKAQDQPLRLETEHQRRGGLVPKYHRGVQEFVDRLCDKFAGDGLSLTMGQLESWLTENAPREDGYEPQPTIPDFDDVEYYEGSLWWKDVRGHFHSLKKRTLDPYIARAKSRDRSSLS